MAPTGSSASRRSSSRRATWPPPTGCPPTQVVPAIREQFRAYRATLQDDRRHLLERFEIVDVARKVVGVGSVGTRAFIVLLQGRDAHDPLFLQIKEATASVLEPYVGKSRYRQHGERVVQGQRMMQAASDIYLGWTKGAGRAPPLLLAPAARHEGLGAGRGDDAARAHVLRTHLRVDAGAGPRPLRGPGRHRRVPGRQRRVRQVDHRLLAAVRRPERRLGIPRSGSASSWTPGGTAGGMPPGRRWSRRSSARLSTCSPARPGWPHSCAAASWGPGWAGRACRWTSGTPRPSRPGSATR